MSPADKRRLAFISLLFISLFVLILTFIPSYLYILFFFVGSCVFCYYKAEEFQLLDRLGLNPRRGLPVLPALQDWLSGRTARAVRSKARTTKSNVRNCVASPGDRFFSPSAYRREAAFSDSVFSPRDVLMGSYLAKAESSSGAGRPTGSSGLHRDQLRERLSRPNHAVVTPNRRLSFGETVSATGRFTIAPQRHYPLQQTGTPSVGVLPPAQWDGFRKKNVLTQRNTPAHSPVTVKIARPDNPTRLSFVDQLNSPGAVISPGFEAQADPCSRETVLNVLRASRKRDVDDEDKGHDTGQKSKRRRNDSSESSQSAFEPLLANGAPLQLVPKPGSLKRGLNVSVLDESTVKRSRTSSISSVGGSSVSCGVLGSARNSIRSSYSSSQGYSQRRAASSLTLSPLVSPGSSRCQTPDRVAKKPREELNSLQSSVSPVKSDKTATEIAFDSGKNIHTSEAPAVSWTGSEGSSGKRKRKIQLVSTQRGDQISLPPPPELGHPITIKDLDMEKKAALSQIQKVLEEPELENPRSVPETSPSPPVGLFSQQAPSFSTSITPVVSSSSLASQSTPAAGSLHTPAQVPVPTIDLTIPFSSTSSAASVQTVTPTTHGSSTTAPKLDNPLLESLKNLKSSPLLSTPSTFAATTAAPPSTAAAQGLTSITSTALNNGAMKSEPALAAPLPTVSTIPSSTSSAFAQILAQPLPLSSTSLSFAGSSLFSLVSAAPTNTAPTITASTQPSISTGNPMPSVFKPIFGAATATTASNAEVKPTQPSFKPIFGNAFSQPGTSVSSTPSTQSTSLLVGGISNNQSSLVPASIPSSQNPTPSLFGVPTNSQLVAASAPSFISSTQNPTQSLFGGLTNSQTIASVSSSSSTQNPTSTLFNKPAKSQQMAAAIPSSTSSIQNPTPSLFGNWNATNNTFQFGPSSTSASSEISTNTTTTSSTNITFQFGALKPTQTAPAPAPATASQNTFTFGQTSTTAPFPGFGMGNNTSTVTSNAPTTQATFNSSVFSTPTAFPNAQASTPAKPFTFGPTGGGGSAPAPLTFGMPASTAALTFGTSTQSAFCGSSTGFPFGNNSATAMSASSVQPPTFTFGAAPATPQNSAGSGGFNFTASLAGAQFATPAPAAQSSAFNFGAGNTDNKSVFGTSTPAFGTTGGPIPFGSPGTPAQGFGASAFGTSSASFSIGAGPKPVGARQRLQARRQHTRKK